MESSLIKFYCYFLLLLSIKPPEKNEWIEALKNYFSFRQETKEMKILGLLNNTEMNYREEGAFVIYDAVRYACFLIHSLVGCLEDGA